jgi:hypothetical protein
MADPFKHPIKIIQGATLRDVTTWKTGATTATALPVDLTGCTARMQIRSKIDSADILVSLTTENGGISLGGALGTVTIVMTATATAALTWKSGVYDLEIVFGSGDVRRLLAGSVSVSPEVTR